MGDYPALHHFWRRSDGHVFLMPTALLPEIHAVCHVPPAGWGCCAVSGDLGGGTWGETDLDTGTQCLPDGFSGLLITPNTYLCACPYIFYFLFFLGGGTVSLGLSAIIAILDNNNNNKEDF